MWPLRAAHTHRPPRNAGLVPHSLPPPHMGKSQGISGVALRRLRFRCLPPPTLSSPEGRSTGPGSASPDLMSKGCPG